MNEGRYIFPQIVDYVPRYQLDKLIAKYKGDYRSHELTTYNQFLHLFFGQITGRKSLRDICMCLLAHTKILFSLGFRKTVDHTTLSRANEKRDYRIYEELGYYLIGRVRPLYAKTKIEDITVDNVFYALDSTTISTSIKLATWAYGKYSKGAVKMHTLLDLRGSIPTNIHITDGKWHDSNELDEINPEPYAIYAMDKAYVDFLALYRYHQAGAFWVSRAKDNMRYRIIETRTNFKASSGIRADYTIQLVTSKSRTLYPENIRYVRCYDEDNDEMVVFITNNFEWDATEIANIYRHRWDIEVFFKWIKQNIVIKTLWGYSENAVKTHLWIAICAYLVMALIKHDQKSGYSITEIATLLELSAFEKADLSELLTKPEDKSTEIFQNQNIKDQLSLTFNF